MSERKVKDSVVYNRMKQEVQEPRIAAEEVKKEEKDEAQAYERRPQRATRGSHGIVQSKRFSDDVVDWSQRPSRLPAKEQRKGIKREQQEQQVVVRKDKKVKKEDEKTAMILEEKQQEIAKEASTRRSKKKKEEKAEEKIIEIDVKVSDSRMPSPQPGPITDRDSAASDISKSESASMIANESKEDCLRQPLPPISDHGTTLAMLVEEHKKIERSVKLFGEMLKSYKEGQDPQTDLIAQSIPGAQGRVRDEESATTCDTPQEDGAGSPPSIEVLRRALLRVS